MASLYYKNKDGKMTKLPQYTMISDAKIRGQVDKFMAENLENEISNGVANFVKNDTTLVKASEFESKANTVIENAGLVKNDEFNDKVNAYLAENNLVNIKSLGAKGDGVTNDSEAFLAAIEKGYSLYIPQGTYLVDRMLPFTYDFTLKGDGKGKSVIKFAETISNKIDDYLIKIDCNKFNIEGISFVYETTTTNSTSNQYLESEGILIKVMNAKEYGTINNCALSCLNNGTATRFTCLWIRPTDSANNVTISECDLINTNAHEVGGVIWISPHVSASVNNIKITNNYMFTKNGDEAYCVWLLDETATIGSVIFNNNIIECDNTDCENNNIVAINGSSEYSQIVINNNSINTKGAIQVYFKFSVPHISFCNNTIRGIDENISQSYHAKLLWVRDAATDIVIKNNYFDISTVCTLRIMTDCNCELTGNTFKLKAYQGYFTSDNEVTVKMIDNIFDVVSTHSSNLFVLDVLGTVLFEKNTFMNFPRFWRNGTTKSVTAKFINNHFLSLSIVLQKAIEDITMIGNTVDEDIWITNSDSALSNVFLMNNIANNYKLQYNYANIKDETAINLAKVIFANNNRKYNGELYECSYATTE